MRATDAITALGMVLAGVSGSAAAMTKPALHEVRCTVTGAASLPPATGGAEAVCRMVRSAAQPVATARGQGATIVVDVIGPSAAVARVTMADGSRLPPARVDVSDRFLNARAIEMLASAAADRIRAGSTKN